MTQQPLAVDPERLFAKIGRLVVENELLREQLAEQQAPESAQAEAEQGGSQ